MIRKQSILESRRDFLRAGLAVAAGAAISPAASAVANEGSPQAAAAGSFEFDEITLESLQSGLAAGKFSSRELVEKYISRIHAIDQNGPAIRALIELNPEALSIADRMDQERRDKKVRGPLHGIPIIIKDNIATADGMQTTAGSLALVGSKPPSDSAVAARLRSAGAVILGKTNLSEWANFRSPHATSGWSGRGGLTLNPYVLDRNPSGSS